MEVFKIVIKNFTKWQKPTEGRKWLAMDAGFFYDRKVREARRQCPDAPECFISLWREADDQGHIEISKSSLKTYWMEVLCIESNRFKVEKRLEALSKAGLISYTTISGEQPDTRRHLLTDDQKKQVLSLGFCVACSSTKNLTVDQKAVHMTRRTCNAFAWIATGANIRKLKLLSKSSPIVA